MLATPMTVKQEKFKFLLDKYKDRAEIIPIPCAGLMEFIEKGVLDSEELEAYLREKILIYDINEISSIVFGCTHYRFIADTIQKVVGKDIKILDGAYGTAREIMRRLNEQNLLSDRNEKGNIKIFNSKEENIQLCWNLINKN